MQEHRPRRHDFITIVSGLPRSGTSMMMQMLEAGGVPVLTDNLREADTDNPRGYYEFEPVKQVARDVSWLADAHGKATKMVYQLLYELPPNYSYRVILMERDLREVVASQNAMLARQGKGQGDLADDALIGVFRRHLDDVTRWLERQPNFRTLRVSYNDVLADPASAVRRVDGFLDGGLDTAAMSNALDVSLYRQRR